MTTNRTLDRRVEFDERSRSFPIRQVTQAKPRAYTWRCSYFLDQGREGACVGFAWAHELGARPVVVAQPSTDLARTLYKEAQKVDEWEGENYEGTSVLAGAKAAQALGFIEGYRWAFGLNDLILAVGYKGPAVLGLNWYTGMFMPNKDGYLTPTGNIEGGHAIMCKGVSIKHKRFAVHNSWGSDWGNQATAWISFDDMDRLLNERGEACIPTIRRRGHS